MAMVFKATPSREPLCNGLAEGADEGFILLYEFAKRQIISKLIYLILVFSPF
jgi:hypothetical protein